MLKKLSPSLYQALGIFLPLITTNCAVLGVAILMIQKEFTLLQSVVYSVSTALGFALALVLFAGIRERLELEDVPESFRGTIRVRPPTPTARGYRRKAPAPARSPGPWRPNRRRSATA